MKNNHPERTTAYARLLPTTDDVVYIGYSYLLCTLNELLVASGADSDGHYCFVLNKADHHYLKVE